MTRWQSNLDPERWPGLDFERLPRHVAVILDGNRRWAKRNLLAQFQGHRAGVDTVRLLVRLCRELDIPHLTLYAFSTENWRRTGAEVDFLMTLIEDALRRELDELHAQGVQVRFIGDVAGLPDSLQRQARVAAERTGGNCGLILNIAANYGGRQELVRAAQQLARRVLMGELSPEAIDEQLVSGALYTADQPDPDLLIRTSGESRISNYMLWQLAYTELYFTDVMWPEFRDVHFLDALRAYQARERRYGANGVAANVPR